MGEVFQAVAAWPVSRAINESSWIFPFIQAFHLVALAFLYGAVLLVDLRLMGKGFAQQPVAQVARDARPWLLGSIVAMMLTGVPQLMSLAMKEYESEFFWNKMSYLAAALVFTFTIRRMVAYAPEGRFGRGVSTAVALVSIFLWAMVAVEARKIGLF